MTNSRQKGARGERELRDHFNRYGFDTRRGQQYCGANGDADVVGLPGIHVECKRTEKTYLQKWIDQAVGDARDDEVPAVFHRRNGEGWLVTMRLDDWMELYVRSIGRDIEYEE